LPNQKCADDRPAKSLLLSDWCFYAILADICFEKKGTGQVNGDLTEGWIWILEGLLE
jgi:hypothetical protein